MSGLQETGQGQVSSHSLETTTELRQVAFQESDKQTESAPFSEDEYDASLSDGEGIALRSYDNDDLDLVYSGVLRVECSFTGSHVP